jgi:hypothetical protein
MKIPGAIGAYTNKESMGELVTKFKVPLVMTALVHERGTMKYESYSWLHSPTKSNSTISANLDAIDRHLSAHSMGKLMDVEGLPHIFHLACRAGMMVTTYLRTLENQFNVMPKRGANTAIGEWASKYPGSQITSEEILACSRKLPEALEVIDNVSPDELYPLIRALLLECQFSPDESGTQLSLDPGDISKIELLFRLIFCFVSSVWKRDKDKYISLLKENFKTCPLRECDYLYLEKYLKIPIGIPDTDK